MQLEAEYMKTKQVKDLDYWRERMKWSDAQFLAEYAEQQRQHAATQLRFIVGTEKYEAMTQDEKDIHGTADW